MYKYIDICVYMYIYRYISIYTYIYTYMYLYINACQNGENVNPFGAGPPWLAT